MSSAKSTFQCQESAWPGSHYDPGEIRTESAIRPSPPDKKERLKIEESQQKTPRKKTSRRRICVYLLFEFFSNSNHDLAREFFKQRICVSKLNIHFDGAWCQAQIDPSHNIMKEVNSVPIRILHESKY